MNKLFVTSRYSNNIPHSEPHIIKQGCKEYTAIYTRYGVTFTKAFTSLKEAGLYLKQYAY